MFKQMIQYYKPLLISIKTMFGYKSSELFGASLLTSITITGIMDILYKDFLGVPIILTSIVSLFILVDFVLGTAASLKIASEAKYKGNNKLYLEKKFKSSKIGYTIFKFMSLFLWLLLSFSIDTKIRDINILNSFINIITIIPVLLFGFREFISIGEGIESLYGNRPYLFKLGEKIFELLQFKFLEKLKK